mmetsp:Transcript_8521/g.26416  ORF Transcript_8521/g.26416 Transcript_8521/m.26416 type:complete len:281 (-) Transcript_8521:527-1369(-)
MRTANRRCRARADSADALVRRTPCSHSPASDWICPGVPTPTPLPLSLVCLAAAARLLPHRSHATQQSAPQPSHRLFSSEHTTQPRRMAFCPGHKRPVLWPMMLVRLGHHLHPPPHLSPHFRPHPHLHLHLHPPLQLPAPRCMCGQLRDHPATHRSPWTRRPPTDTSPRMRPGSPHPSLHHPSTAPPFRPVAHSSQARRHSSQQKTRHSSQVSTRWPPPIVTRLVSCRSSPIAVASDAAAGTHCSGDTASPTSSETRWILRSCCSACSIFASASRTATSLL